MCTIRALNPSDFNRVCQIHEKYYSSEFTLPDFFKFLCAFVVADSNDKIICVGGIKPIAESIIITDKDFSVKERREALLRVLDASSFMAGKAGFNQLHAFIQDEDWMKHLEKYNFKPTKGKAFYLNL